MFTIEIEKNLNNFCYNIFVWGEHTENILENLKKLFSSRNVLWADKSALETFENDDTDVFLRLKTDDTDAFLLLKTDDTDAVLHLKTDDTDAFLHLITNKNEDTDVRAFVVFV